MTDRDQTSTFRPAMGSSRSVSDTTTPRARKYQACYPCRMRKVKCGRDRPCIECVKRDHTELCSYERPRRKQAIAELTHAPYKDDSTGKMPVSRISSHANMAANCGQVSDARGYLDNVCARLNGLEHIISSVRTVLGPVNGMGLGLIPEIVKTPKSAVYTQPKGYIKNNRTSTDCFQALLEGDTLPKMLLDNESATYPFVNLWSPGISAYDISPVCYALLTDQQCKELFAQYRDVTGVVYPVIRDVPRFEKTLDLMLRNRAATDRPTLDAIQTLLVLSNVLLNNMNSGISYLLLGLTSQMGPTLGLHANLSPFSTRERYLQRHVWWVMAWEDSYHSLFYDRPLTTALLNWETIQAYKRKVQNIFTNTSPYLRDSASCSSLTKNLEHAILKLYSSYFLLELCRLVFRCTIDASNPLTACIRAKNLEHLITTIKAFVELHTFNPHASRCRMAQQCAIISLLLLAVTEDARSTPQFCSENYFNHSTDSSLVSSCTRSTFTSLTDRNLLFSNLPSLDVAHTTSVSSAALKSPFATTAPAAANIQMRRFEPLARAVHALEQLEACLTPSSSSRSDSHVLTSKC
ncbi:hypothetical protein BJY00DRAFT_302340 [Aspergillus carlsbadensis]|nr:hypothetical protein BJY00DRAFT_302340 [Aspergillus carlsbadensis]